MLNPDSIIHNNFFILKISWAQTNETIKNYFDQDFIETNNSINSINQQNQLISSQRKSFKLENYKDTNDSIAHMSMISTTHVFVSQLSISYNSLVCLKETQEEFAFTRPTQWQCLSESNFKSVLYNLSHDTYYILLLLC